MTPIEANVKPVTFNVQVSDPDGYTDISTVTAEFSYPGEPTRSGSCSRTSGAGNTATYSCAVDMQYYDKGLVSWNVLVTATDSLPQQDTDNTQSFVYLELKAMIITSPPFGGALNWPPLNPSASNVLSNNDPSIIENTGNAEGGVFITAYDLIGQTNPIYSIPASSFRAGSTSGSECTVSTQLQHATIKPIGISFLTRGPGATEQIYYCLTSVPYVSSQAFSTSWTIQI